MFCLDGAEIQHLVEMAGIEPASKKPLSITSTSLFVFLTDD